jgi:hypothetical protein
MATPASRSSRSRGRSPSKAAGRDLLAVFVVGYEVSARIKRASATRLAVHLDLERVPDVAALAGDAGC